MDQRPLSWPKFHAASGLGSSIPCIKFSNLVVTRL